MFMAEADIQIKAEPLDEDFSTIKVEEFIIKPEIEDFLQNCLDLPERSRKDTLNLLIPREEPQNEDENKLSPIHFRTPSPRTPPRTPPRTLSPKPDLQCGTCKRNFNNSQSLDDHKRLRCRNPNACRFCGQIFRTYLILQDHEQQHRNKGSPTKESKKTSPLQPKGGSKPPVRHPKVIYICRVCTMSFVTQNRLTKHYKETHNILKYICNRCGMSFSVAGQFKKHTKACTEKNTEDVLGILGISRTDVVPVSLVPRSVTENLVMESVVAASDVPIKEEPQDYNNMDNNLTQQLLNGSTIVTKVEPTETEEMIMDATGNNFEIKTEDPIDTIPTDFIKEEPTDNESESPSNDSSLDYEDLILKELIDRKAKSIARKVLNISITSSKVLNGYNNGVTSQIESPSLENTDFENVIATNTLTKNRGNQSIAVVKRADPLVTEQRTKDFENVIATNTLAKNRGDQSIAVVKRADPLVTEQRTKDFENVIATNTLAKNRGDQSIAVVKRLNPLVTEQRTKDFENGIATNTLAKNRGNQSIAVVKRADPLATEQQTKDFENGIATNTLAKNRGNQSIAVVKRADPLATEQQTEAVINGNQLGGGIVSASKLGIFGTANQSTDSKTIKTVTKLPTRNVNQSTGILITSPLQTVQIKSTRLPMKRKSITESALGSFLIPNTTSTSNFQHRSDIEMISDPKSQFQNKTEVIESLKQEYQKAKKKKLNEGLINDTSEHSKPSVQPSDKMATPCSVFFPLCGDPESYNEAIRMLDKAFRYSWICSWCPRRYIQRHAFSKHVSSAHCKNELDIQDLLFELRPERAQDVMPESCYCHICRVTLADPDSLQKHRTEFHKKDSTPKVQFKCEKCGKFCSTRSTLSDHIEADCGREPQYVCKICDKKFYTKSTLSLHNTMHTGVLPHRCEYCDKCFRTRGQLTVHTRTHTGERPFPCKVCDRRFTHRETLIAHLSRHIDMKRYKCYGCDKFFSCISGLKTHRLTRMSTCGQIRLNARPVGPRVRVIKGNVIFEPQPKINPYFRRYDLNCDKNRQNPNKNGIFQKQNQENVKDLVKNNETVSMAEKS